MCTDTSRFVGAPVDRISISPCFVPSCAMFGMLVVAVLVVVMLSCHSCVCCCSVRSLLKGSSGGTQKAILPKKETQSHESVAGPKSSFVGRT